MDYYGGDDTATDPTADSQPADDSSELDAGKTALINSDICPGMNVGDHLTLKIEKVMEGEYEVSYIPEKEEEASESEPAAAAPSGGMSGMYD
jgi:hypothetical protein